MIEKRARKASRILISDPTQLIQFKKKSFSMHHHIFQPIKNAIVQVLSCIPVLQPTHNIVLAFDILTAVVITYYYFEITLVLVFGDQFWKYQFSHPLTILINVLSIMILWANVLLEFKKGYYQQGILVLDPTEIIKNIGILNLLNLVYSAVVVSLGFYTKVFYVNYFKIGFLFRLITLKKIDKNIQKHLLRSKNLCTVYLIARLFLILVFFSHIMGLLFYVLDRHLLQSNYFGQETASKCWLATSQSINNLIESDWSTQYIYTFYWAVNYLTSIAFGDIAPLNAIQAGFLGIISMISIFHFNYFIFMIVKILMQHRLKSEQHQQNRKQVSEFLFKNLEKKSYESIMNHYEQSKQMRRSEHQINDIIKILPNKLQYDLLGNIYQEFIERSNLLNLFTMSLMQKVLFIINVKQVDEGDNLYSVEDKNLNLYYLKQGKVSFSFYDKYIIETIEQGPFDLFEFISGKQKRFQAKAVASSILYQIQRKQFLKIVQQKQQYVELLRYKIDLIDSGKQGKVIDLRCLICHQAHLTQKCPSTFFAIKQSPKIKDENQRRKKSHRRNYQTLKFYSGTRRIDNKYQISGQNEQQYLQSTDLLKDNLNPIYIEELIKDLEKEVKINEIEVDVGRNYQYYFPGFNVASILLFWEDNFSFKSSSE